MKNQRQNTPRGRKILLGGVLTAVASTILWVATTGDHIASIWTNIHNPEKGDKTVSVAPVSPPAQQASRPNPPAARTEPVTQVSSGVQSPNLNNVHGSVHLQYGPSDGEPPTAPGKSASVDANRKSSIQVSTGAQSANISGVDKDVEIDFNASGNKQVR